MGYLSSIFLHKDIGSSLAAEMTVCFLVLFLSLRIPRVNLLSQNITQEHLLFFWVFLIALAMVWT